MSILPLRINVLIVSSGCCQAYSRCSCRTCRCPWPTATHCAGVCTTQTCGGSQAKVIPSCCTAAMIGLTLTADTPLFICTGLLLLCHLHQRLLTCRHRQPSMAPLLCAKVCNCMMASSLTPITPLVYFQLFPQQWQQQYHQQMHALVPIRSFLRLHYLLLARLKFYLYLLYRSGRRGLQNSRSV
jgi:hypothetical protein